MPAPSTEKKVRGGRLQYKSRFIAKLTSVCEPPLLRKDQPVVWNEQCQIAFDNMKEYLMNLPVLQQPRPGKPLIFYFAIEETSVGAMVPKKVVKGRAVAEFLAQQPIDDQEWSLEFPDEHLRSITVQGWRMYFDGASNKAGAGIWSYHSYPEDPCYEKKQEPVMVATVEEKPWFYDVQKYLQDREYPDHPLTRQSSES
ncbi:UNVERIFIED_CONTAM: hypothetical protein Sradi_6910200 [Sesamum radiatum]|uniref:Reverse transcriptase/retrotransposon-derived protein RNase H-like domain-containing protein n=1 Tax=Sesamum radiatum TaxID=300843 RepID=A0AAW2JK41_SESRA